MDKFRSELLEALQRLAESPAEQEAYLRKLDVGIDELALEYDDLFHLVDAKFRTGELGASEREALSTLSKVLDDMSGPKNADLWTTDALQHRDEWREVRRLAGKALAVINRVSAAT